MSRDEGETSFLLLTALLNISANILINLDLIAILFSSSRDKIIMWSSVSSDTEFYIRCLKKK